MKFKQATLKFLREIHGNDTYAGGTNKTKVAELEAYVSSKTVKQVEFGLELRNVSAEKAFSWCYYAPVEDAEAAENGLLNTPSSWNQQGESNLEPESGIVYVLTPKIRHDRPLEEELRDLLGQ